MLSPEHKGHAKGKSSAGMNAALRGFRNYNSAMLWCKDWSKALVVFLALAVSCALPQTDLLRQPRSEPTGKDNPSTGKDNTRKIDLPIDDWLEQPERTDIPWKVALSHPVLTYQLRNLVRVRAVVDADVLQKQGARHDLHFIVKAAEEGIWEETESYSHFPVEAALAKNIELEMLADLYLQPGDYKIAAILYDGVTKQRNVTFTHIQVAAEQNALPELLRGLPTIEFLPPPENAAPLGGGRISLAVTTQRPVQLDLIVDLSTHEEEEPTFESAGNPDWAGPPLSRPDPWSDLRRRRGRHTNVAAEERYGRSGLLQTATVLSAIDLKDGCVQVMAVDILRRRVIVPFTAASEVNWEKIRRDEVLGSGGAMVSVSDLRDKKKSGTFFADTVEQRMQQPPECKLESTTPVHMIAVLTRGIHLPEGSAKPKIPLERDCKIIYLQQLSGSTFGDDLKDMLAPLAPLVLRFGDPHEFRRRLLELAQHLEKLS